MHPHTVRDADKDSECQAGWSLLSLVCRHSIHAFQIEFHIWIDCFALPQMLNELRPKEGSSVSGCVFLCTWQRFNPDWTVLIGSDFWECTWAPAVISITELMSAFNAVPLNDPKIQHPVHILSLAHCARRFPNSFDDMIYCHLMWDFHIKTETQQSIR